jgi:hypothetical protein
MGGVSHSGDRFSPARYQKLDERFALQRLHNGTALLGFSTIDWYRANQFPFPMEMNFTFNRAFGGQNTPSGDLYHFEALFFL